MSTSSVQFVRCECAFKRRRQMLQEAVAKPSRPTPKLRPRGLVISAAAHGLHAGIQGGPAKVRPTYFFAGNIILVTFGKIQCFLANVITV